MNRVRALLGALLVLVAGPAGAQLTPLGAVQLFECLTLGDCDQDDHFGAQVATGDFDDDGFADLVVGIPGESVSGHADAGAVHVYYGSRGGVKTTGDQIFDQSNAVINGGPGDGERFGQALASGDFDGDGVDDLAIGAPGEDIGDADQAGAVAILFGSDGTGLTTTGMRRFSQNTLPSPESAEAGDQFGASLAAGRGFGSAFDQLAIGVPFESQGAFNVLIDAGVVEVLGSSGGVPLTTMDEVQQVFSCDGNPLETEAFDVFGGALAFRRRGTSGEWVVGVPGESFSGRQFVGVVSFDGVDECWSQDTSGVQDAAEASDSFGQALATGDFNGDGKEDVAVGVPIEGLESSSEEAAGAVNVLYSDGTSFDRITATGDQLFTQDAFLSDELAESRDHFGSSLAAADFDGDGIDDLAIGAPRDGESGHGGAGAVGVLYGRPVNGLGGSTHQTFDEGFPAGMPGAPPQTDGAFGTALAAGDFDGNGVADLVIGAPHETAVNSEDGTVTILYGKDRSINAFGTVQFSSATVTVDEPSTSTTHFLVLTRSLSAVVEASVDYARTGGAATPGSDFTLNPGTRTWPQGNATVKVVSFDVLPDTLDEGDETVVVTLSNPTAGTAIGATDTVTITILDDDVAGALSLHQSAYSVSEGAGSVSIQVDRAGGDASGVSVHFATSNGSATAGSDYTATSTNVVFGAGQTSLFVGVPILQDSLREGAETVTVTLSSPGGGGALGSPSTATITIVDDELIVDGFESGNLSVWSAHT